MNDTVISVAAAEFGRDLEQCFATIGALIDQARERGSHLLVLPEACLGGYLPSLGGGQETEEERERRRKALPPAFTLDAPEFSRLRAMAGDLVITLGFCEADGESRYNAAVTLTGDGILGAYRKVHQPLGENLCYQAGSSFQAFDTPVGRMGMQICYDKAFPEAARALENQVVWVASNQAGTFGSLRFVCSAKIVGPGGDTLATTGVAPGLATAAVDISERIGLARGGGMNHLGDRRPDVYRSATVSEWVHA
jgi:nitrilase